MFVLEFPRDGTVAIRDRMSRCPFVLEQKYFLVLLSLCPGTRAPAKILGQTPLFRVVLGQNHFLLRNQVTFPKETKKQKKDILKQEKEVLKQERTF